MFNGFFGSKPAAAQGEGEAPTEGTGAQGAAGAGGEEVPAFTEVEDEEPISKSSSIESNSAFEVDIPLLVVPNKMGGPPTLHIAKVFKVENKPDVTMESINNTHARIDVNKKTSDIATMITGAIPQNYKSQFQKAYNNAEFLSTGTDTGLSKVNRFFDVGATNLLGRAKRKITGSVATPQEVRTNIQKYINSTPTDLKKYDDLKEYVDNTGDKWVNDAFMLDKYKELVSEVTRIGQASSVISSAASSAASYASNLVSSSDATAAINAIEFALDNNLNNMDASYKKALKNLKTYIESNGSPDSSNPDNATIVKEMKLYGIASYDKMSIGVGNRTNFSRIKANLPKFELSNDNKPRWKGFGRSAFTSPTQFMQALLTSIAFGGKRTRKHKKSKTQKGGRRHKKTRKH